MGYYVMKLVKIVMVIVDMKDKLIYEIINVVSCWFKIVVVIDDSGK